MWLTFYYELRLRHIMNTFMGSRLYPLLPKTETSLKERESKTLMLQLIPPVVLTVIQTIEAVVFLAGRYLVILCLFLRRFFANY